MRLSKVLAWARRLVVVCGAVTLAACGGGGGGGGSSGSGSGGTPQAAIAPPEAARFLTQATFGVTDADIDAVRNAGFSAWINQQIAAPQTTPSHQAYVDDRLTQLRAANANASLSANQFYESWWRQAVTGNDQLRQRVAFAYSQIFVISLNDPNVDVRGAASYYDMLARNAFGNFRTLLEDITLHPMMGRYLTYLANQREDAAGTRTPDENYAREVMQLMTLGLYELNPDGSVRNDSAGNPIPAYTARDIAELAKVFTGWSWYHPTPSNTTFFGGNANADRSVRAMIHYPQYYSLSAKAFLGITIPATTQANVNGAADLDTALDRLFNHPNVGPFLAERLIQQLVTSNPSRGYVQRVAAVFANNGSNTRGDMGAVIRAILTDAEARDMSAPTSQTFGKLREPVIRTANWLRSFGATSQTGNWLITSTSANTSLGQSPLNSPSVFNFWRPGFTPPATTQIGQRNLRAPEMQGLDEVTSASYVNVMQSWVQDGIGSTPPGGSGRDVRTPFTAELAVAADATALVDRLNRILLYGQMSSTLRQRLIDGVNSIAIPTATGTNQAQIDAARLNRVRLAVFATLVSPEFIVQR